MKNTNTLTGDAMTNGIPPTINVQLTDLVNSNLSLVDTMAKLLMKQNDNCSWLTESDLLGAGYEALFDAARVYDATREASFKTYASHCVRNAMLAEIKRMCPIKVSDNQRKTIAIVRNDTDDSDWANPKPSVFDEFQSLKLGCNWDIELQWQLEMLEEAMIKLKSEERLLLRYHYGFDKKCMTLQEIASLFNVSPQAIQKRIKGIETKLRTFIEGASASYRLCA